MAHEAFIARHFATLERDSARHNLILGLIEEERDAAEPRLQTFTLGGPGACAVYSPGRNVLLADLSQARCHRFAEQILPIHPEGVLGPERSSHWYVERSIALGERFAQPEQLSILALGVPPAALSVPGRPRVAAPEDATQVADWIEAFHREAIPHEPLPDRARLLQSAAQGRHFLWVVDGRPVAVARISRRMRLCGAIGPVYTPPAERNRGYGAAITAHVAERLFAEGKVSAALYVQANNGAAGRCYGRIGFRPVCTAWHYHRLTGEAGPTRRS